MRERGLSVPVRVAISAALLGALVWWIGPAELAAAIADLRWGWFALAFAVDVVAVLLGSLNVLVLTRAIEPSARPNHILVAYLRSWAVGMVAPGKLGDLSYAHFLAEERHAEDTTNLAPGLAVSIVDKFVTFVVTASIAVVGLALYARASDALLGGLGAVVLVALALVALFDPRIRTTVRTRLLGTYAERFAGFSAHMRTLLRERRGALALNLGLTVGRTLVQALALLLYFLALGQSVGLLDVVIVQAVSLIVSLVPITFAGLGVRQGAGVVLYGRIAGLRAAPVLAHGLITTVTGYLLVGLVFAVLGTGTKRRA